MSKFILPLDHIDFSAVVAEIEPFIPTQSLDIMSSDWHTVSYILVEIDDLSATKEKLTALNVAPFNFVYIKRDGFHEKYQAAHWPLITIMLPISVSNSFMSVYYVPIDAEKLPDGGYHAEDCEFIERYSLDIPLLATSISRRAGYELAYSLEVPEGETYKAISIFAKEPIDTDELNVFKPNT